MKHQLIRRGVVFGMAAAFLITAGCGEKKVEEVAPGAETVTEREENAQTEAAPVAEEAAIAETETKEKPSETNGDPIFTELSEWFLVLTSGAGGWETTLTVEPDGSFSGDYHDSEMGETGETYENGTVYISDFSGQFDGYTKVSDTVYELHIGSLDYKNSVGTEEIEEDVRYVYSEAYGLSGTENLLLYLPGTATAELPEGYMNWIKPLHFGAYVEDEYYEDVPPELPFLGLYNQDVDLGFYSDSRSSNNKRFLMNRASFPGLVSSEETLNEDGTYRYEDTDRNGLFRVVNLCFPVSDEIGLFSNEDEFAKTCISEVTGGEAPEEYYAIGVNDEYYQAKTYISGDRCMQLSWTSGSNEDTTEWVARAMKRDGYEPGNGYAYVYAIGYDADGELMTGEAADFLLTSLCISGLPDHLSTASQLTAERKIYVEAKAGSDESRIEGDEVELLGTGDTEKLAQYGMDLDDITNDYVIGGFEEDFTEYSVAEDCCCFIQYSDNPFQKLKNREEFHQFLTDWDGTRLLILYLDEKDQVVFTYEPYTP